MALRRPRMSQKLKHEISDRSGHYMFDAWMTYLETMGKMWPVKLDMIKADHEGDWAQVDRLKPEIQKIANEAKRPMTEALRWRVLADQLYEQNKDFRQQEDEKCSKDPIRFFNHWCFTSDPRLPPLGLPAMIP